MKRILNILLLLAAVSALSFYSEKENSLNREVVVEYENVIINSNNLTLTQRENKFFDYTQSIYNCLGDSTLNIDAFSYALKGHYALKNEGKLENENQLIVIDFNMSSAKERFFIIDLETESIVYKKLVAHGRNSGNVFPTKFSNRSESHMSSLGFYVTGSTYNGKYKNSLLINGQESTNSKARARGVVIHSANYVTQKYLDRNGRLGRSYGCPALPHKDYKEIINLIKDGTTLFIYYKDQKYLSTSEYLNKENYLQTFY